MPLAPMGGAVQIPKSQNVGGGEQMRRMLGVLGVLLVAAAIPAVATFAFVGNSALGGSSSEEIFEFEHMVGVSGAFLGSTNPLRGVNGGGIPWVLAEGEASLKSDGTFQVEVKGLVLAATGTNPAPFFFATLSCLSAANVVVNINTATVPVTIEGDAEIEQVLTLPSTCIAPIVLVRGSFTGSPAGPWFAASGF